MSLKMLSTLCFKSLRAIVISNCCKGILFLQGTLMAQASKRHLLSVACKLVPSKGGQTTRRAGSMHVFLEQVQENCPRGEKSAQRVPGSQVVRCRASFAVSSLSPLAPTVKRTPSKLNTSAPQRSEREKTAKKCQQTSASRSRPCPRTSLPRSHPVNGQPYLAMRLASKVSSAQARGSIVQWP